MLRMQLDERNNQFTLKVLNYFHALEKFSTPYLEWLSMEHYQFSLNNTRFLMMAHHQTQSLNEKGVSAELLANYNEEKNHAQMYQHALSKIGLNVSNRMPCSATKSFFTQLEMMIQRNASRTLGVMYATETAAIFEHVLFKKISEEICQRQNLPFENSRIKQFHDLHLDGVEQAHKDELGVFITPAFTQEEGDPHTHIQENEIRVGALEAIDSMEAWWFSLIKAQEQLEELAVI